MDLWLSLLLLSIFLCLALAILLLGSPHAKSNKEINLPPGPPTIPLLGNFLWPLKSFSTLTPTLRRLRAIYGPIVTLRIGCRPAIFIMDRHLAHRSLVQNGSAFAHRTPPLGTTRALGSNLHSINNTAYGPVWRLLRHNLSSGVFNPSRLHSFIHARRWALDTLFDHLKSQAKEGGGIVAPAESFQFAIFRFLTYLCFGEKLDEQAMRTLRSIQLDILSLAVNLAVFNLLPKFAMVPFMGRWRKLVDLRRRQDDLVIPIVQSRRSLNRQDLELVSYVDTLLDLKLVEEGGRELNEEEIVNLCSEFLNAGTETTSTALEWIMVNLAKHQGIQAKLVREIEGLVGRGEVIEEKDIKMMPYLKAVVLEGLRRHPPAHFLLPHTVADDDVILNGYAIPKGATVNYTVAEMGWDDEAWEAPLEFRPERFLAGGEGDGVDLMGSAGIKMMPFGAGRRVCPGVVMAMHLLQYLVANLVAEFRWKEVDGEGMDLSEKPGLVVGTKNVFRARIAGRSELP